MQSVKLKIVQFLLAGILGAAITAIVFKTIFTTGDKGDNNIVQSASANCNYEIKRRGGFSFVRPLLYAEKECESPKLMGLKDDIGKLVEARKAAGEVGSVSVYLRVFSKGDWICYNEGETYHPASLNKIATLITYMRAEENAPGLLDQKILFKAHDKDAPVYSAKTLEPGKYYSIRELLHYMIAYSDNESTILLLKHARPEFHYRTYTELGFPKPDAMTGMSAVTAKDFSVFMKVIYNATYLSANSSEFCDSLLTACDFKEGLVKPLPPNVPVAHKFGEYRDANGYELHEAGIVYNKDKPYLIVVMTKGPDYKKLQDMVSEISGFVYNSISNDSKL